MAIVGFVVLAIACLVFLLLGGFCLLLWNVDDELRGLGLFFSVIGLILLYFEWTHAPFHIVMN
jgi:hypothetical protein